MSVNLRSLILKSRRKWLTPFFSSSRAKQTGLARLKLSGLELIGFREPEILPSLEQREEARNVRDPEVDRLINIGYSTPNSRRDRRQREKEQAAFLKTVRKDPDLERAARHRTLAVPLDEVKKEWEALEGPDQVAGAAMHYGVFRDLYGRAYFIPQFPLRVKFGSAGDYETPVYRGNLISPCDALTAPTVNFPSAEDSLWSLLLTNLDGHLQETEAEYVHWFIGNIPGGDVSKGETVVDYLQPIPLRGSGFHRYVFVLYKQEKKMDFSQYRAQADGGLHSRTFRTPDFYRHHQSDLTPTSMAFFTSEWDESVTGCFHKTLDQTEPSFSYDHKPIHIAPQMRWPPNKPFNLYLDRYREKQDIAEEMMKKRLKIVSPFARDPPMSKWPLLTARMYEGKLFRLLPTWKKMEVRKEWIGHARYKLIYNPLASWPN